MVWKEVTLSNDDERKTARIPKDLSEVSQQTLVDWKLEIDETIGRIKEQITEAKAKVAVEGIYSDRDWFRRVNHALNIHKKHSQRIQFEFRRRKLETQEHNKNKERLFSEDFMKAAKELLPQALYQEIVDRTKDLRTVERLKETK